MKKIYCMKDEFFAAHPNCTTIKNMRKINKWKERYYIDCDTCSVYRVEHFHKNSRVNEFGQTYDLVLAQLETDGTSRTKQGHRCVHIENRVYTIAKLLAATYIYNPDPKVYTEVRHINGLKLDDGLSNLEWCTKSDLMRAYHAQKNDAKNDSVNKKITTKIKEPQIKTQILNDDTTEDDDDVVYSRPWTHEELAKYAHDFDEE